MTCRGRLSHTQSLRSPGRSPLRQGTWFSLLVAMFLITPTLTAQENQSEPSTSSELSSTAHGLLRTSILLSDVIADWNENSEQQLRQQQELSKRLEQAQNTAAEQTSLSQTLSQNLDDLSSSSTLAIETLETQLEELRSERDQEAKMRLEAETRSRRRGVALLGAIGIAVLEAVIIALQ